MKIATLEVLQMHPLVNALGGFSQIGMVVADADKAMAYMADKLGIGPFYALREISPENYYYRGKPMSSPVITLCFAQAGPVQIELIQQHDDTPSAYREFLAAGREGCQHLSIWFAEHAAYERARGYIDGSGFTMVHESKSSWAPFAYFATDMPGGLMLEIAEARTPATRHIFEGVAKAAQAWDGADPIRALS
jgi:hypothetical protein